MTEPVIIGRVLATVKTPTTIDNFTFWTDPKLILNPFDIVKVDHVDGSYTYGMVEDIAHITDSASFLTNYISSDFGDVKVESPTLRIGMNYVTTKVVHNTKNIYIPCQNGAKVFLASEEEIEEALGLKNVRNPLVCGYLEMYEGTEGGEKVTLPVRLNSKFLVGPEGAHLNISGISGLAAKTSYAMFLMKAIQDRYLNGNNDDPDDSVAFVMFNVKGKDLLTIDQPNDYSDDENPEKVKKENLELYERLGLSSEPFQKVTYYYPYSGMKYWNTYLSKEEVEENIELKKAWKYKYTYENDVDSLDLLFSNIDDPTQTMDSIVNYILTKQGDFGDLHNWNEFLDAVKKKCDAGMKTKTDKEIPIVSWRKFHRIVNKAINDKTAIFANRPVESKRETRLGDALKHIEKNQVHVIDIAKLPEYKQAFVFGDAVRTLYNLKLGEYDVEDVDPPARIIIFIDELNKYASKDAPRSSPILQQILDVAERGRSLGVVLFSAEQFRSAIHDRVNGNCSTHAYGRTNSIEVAKTDYKSIPSVYKTMMTRLKQGEYIIQNPIFRSLLHIKFPKPIYKQVK